MKWIINLDKHLPSDLKTHKGIKFEKEETKEMIKYILSNKFRAYRVFMYIKKPELSSVHSYNDLFANYRYTFNHELKVNTYGIDDNTKGYTKPKVMGV